MEINKKDLILNENLEYEHDDIAIIGISCKFGNKIRSPLNSRRFK